MLIFIVQPIEVSRKASDPGSLSGRRIDSTWRSDVFVPAEADRKYTSEEMVDGNLTSVKNRLRFDSFESALYARLTGRYILTLTAEDKEKLAYDQDQFVRTA